MKEKLRVVCLIISLVCLCAAVYLGVDYIRNDAGSEKSLNALRSMKESAAISTAPVKVEYKPSTVSTKAIEYNKNYSGETTVVEAETPKGTYVAPSPAPIVNPKKDVVPQKTGPVMDNEAQAINEIQPKQAEIIEAETAGEQVETGNASIKGIMPSVPITTSIPVGIAVLPEASVIDADSSTITEIDPEEAASAVINSSIKTDTEHETEKTSIKKGTVSTEPKQILLVPVEAQETVSPENSNPSESVQPSNKPSQPTVSDNEILPEYKEMVSINREMVGWLYIDDTVIDYPVLQPEDTDYYLKHDFYGEKSNNGMLVVSKQYDVFTPDPVFIIHGHNMRNGKMFNAIMNYSYEEWGKEHPFIRFDTLTERRVYKAVSAFYTRIYADDEPGFRYNVLIENKAVMKYFVDGIRENARYVFDPDDDYSIDDEYLVLSTCAYQEKDGRFIVVAKRVA